MNEDYLLATVRYVERNPVAAGLCETAGQWPWSSTGAHLRGEDDGLVRVKPMLDRIKGDGGIILTKKSLRPLFHRRRRVAGPGMLPGERGSQSGAGPVGGTGIAGARLPGCRPVRWMAPV